jgi:hypothetical protein
MSAFLQCIPQDVEVPPNVEAKLVIYPFRSISPTYLITCYYKSNQNLIFLSAFGRPIAIHSYLIMVIPTKRDDPRSLTMLLYYAIFWL